MALLRRAKLEKPPEITSMEDLEKVPTNRKDFIREFRDLDLNWSAHRLVIDKDSLVKLSLSRIICLFVLLIIGLSGFFIIHLELMNLEGINDACLHLFVSINLLFLLKCVQTIYYNREIFSANGIDLKHFFTYFLPIFFFLGFFAYLLWINEPFDLLENLNYATQDEIAKVLPILLYIVFGLSLLKMGLDRISGDIDALIKDFKEKKYEDQYARLRHQVINHIKYSTLLLFLTGLILFYYELDLISIICFSAGILCVFNLFYCKKSDSLMDRKLEKLEKCGETPRKSYKMKWKEKKENKRSFILNPWMLSILGVGIFIFLTYWFNWWDTQDNIMKVFDTIFGNLYLYTLLIINGIYFILIPVVKLIIFLYLYIARVIYKKGLKKFFNQIFVSIVMIFVLKIVVFNIQALQLGEIWEWLIVIGITVLIIYLSTKLKFVKGVV